MRAKQNALSIALDVQRFDVAALGRSAHDALGRLHTEHRMRRNLPRDLHCAAFDLSRRVSGHQRGAGLDRGTLVWARGAIAA